MVERNERCWTQYDMKYMNILHRKDVKFVMLHLLVRIVTSEIWTFTSYFYTSLETVKIVQLFEELFIAIIFNCQHVNKKLNQTIRFDYNNNAAAFRIAVCLVTMLKIWDIHKEDFGNSNSLCLVVSVGCVVHPSYVSLWGASCVRKWAELCGGGVRLWRERKPAARIGDTLVTNDSSTQ